MVPWGWRRRSVGEPGLKTRCPSAVSPIGMWECPKTTRSAAGKRVRRRAVRPLRGTAVVNHRRPAGPRGRTRGSPAHPRQRRRGRRCCRGRPSPARTAQFARTATTHTSPACRIRSAPAERGPPPPAGTVQRSAARECPRTPPLASVHSPAVPRHPVRRMAGGARPRPGLHRRALAPLPVIAAACRKSSRARSWFRLRRDRSPATAGAPGWRAAHRRMVEERAEDGESGTAPKARR